MREPLTYHRLAQQRPGDPSGPLRRPRSRPRTGSSRFAVGHHRTRRTPASAHIHTTHHRGKPQISDPQQDQTHEPVLSQDQACPDLGIGSSERMLL